MSIKSTTTTTEGEKKGPLSPRQKKKKKKIQRIYRKSQTIKIINVFLELETFPSRGIAVHLTSLGCSPTLP